MKKGKLYGIGKDKQRRRENREKDKGKGEEKMGKRGKDMRK
jgi:hypothetical protein